MAAPHPSPSSLAPQRTSAEASPPGPGGRVVVASPRPLKGMAFALAAGLLAGCVVVPRQPPPPRVARPAPPAPAAAAPMYFYPERGQSEAVQDRDRYECYRWAVRETDFDPGMTPVRQAAASVAAAPAAPPRSDGSEVLAGAAAGAVMGAAVSSPRHAAGHAVLGAIFGAALGAAAAEARQDRTPSARPAPPPVGAAPPQMNNFRRAMSACMQGRGYRVG